MTADELDRMVDLVREAEFRYCVAAVRRASHLRQLAELERVPMADRTVAMMRSAAHHSREARDQERVMNDAVQRAQALEAQALLATEEHNDGTPTEDAAAAPDS